MCALAVSGSALAQEAAKPAIHPIYAAVPGSGHNERAQRLFSETVARYRLGPVQVMDIPGPPAPRAPQLVIEGKSALEKLKLAEAETVLDAAVTDVLGSGGDGLKTDGLSDLFLLHGWAAHKATWKEASGKPNVPPKAMEAYVRAAVLSPELVLEGRRYPPLVMAGFRLASAEVKARPRGTVVVRGAPSAEISVDGGPTLLAPATVENLPFGEHLVRVEDVGHKPWSAVVTLTQQRLEIDAPRTAPLLPDDAEAAGHARRMGAANALVAALKLGPSPELELHLVDAVTGQRRDAVVVPLGGQSGALDAAVMRLDEQARRRELERAGLGLPSELAIGTAPQAPPPTGPQLRDDPGGWARQNWPLLTAIGAAVGTALVLGIAVATDH
jgi:hypothetical protein